MNFRCKPYTRRAEKLPKRFAHIRWRAPAETTRTGSKNAQLHLRKPPGELWNNRRKTFVAWKPPPPRFKAPKGSEIIGAAEQNSNALSPCCSPSFPQPKKWFASAC